MAARVLRTTPTETLTPAAMARMDSPRWRRARMAARLSSSTTGRRAADPAAFAGGHQAVAGLADDVAATVFG
jgi:hypothetical protein